MCGDDVFNVVAGWPLAEEYGVAVVEAFVLVVELIQQLQATRRVVSTPWLRHCNQQTCFLRCGQANSILMVVTASDHHAVHEAVTECLIMLVWCCW